MMELIRLEMTPKERKLAYARGEEVDRIPTSLSAGETAPPLYGIDIRDYYFSADAMVEVETRLANDFQADNMGVGLGLRTLVEALGTKLIYPRKNVSYIAEPALKSFGDIENMELVNVEKDGRFPIIIEAFERLQAQFGEERILGSGLAGPLTTAASLIGTENFLKATIKNKEGVHRLLQYSTDCIIKCLKDLNRKLGIGFMLSEPMAARNLLSKKQFNEFFLPYLKQAVERMNEFQRGTSIHICGNTKDRWEEVVEAKVSGFWVDNCESLKELKEAFGDRVAISGNVIPVEVLRDGTPEEIAENVRFCIEQAGDNPCGYNLCPGCTTPVGTSKENMIAFMNAAAIYGRGARKGYMPKGIEKNYKII
ncbi:uroporphyrinogen decarboxylase family protein [Sporofaciens musculi]|uniref:uroporphyrinogen decarboxylase family protein n=1 Tax=Sporofaciens musculi TaxID=2681861 RepID=UPI00256FB45A|nr:uroporphyrinogen decarboxylase family protein [Sporofaciens musculi]